MVLRFERQTNELMFCHLLDKLSTEVTISELREVLNAERPSQLQAYIKNKNHYIE